MVEIKDSEELNRLEDVLNNLNCSTKVEAWWELNLSTTEYGNHKADSYFKNKDIAAAVGRGRGFYGANDAIVKKVLVLTSDGKTGYIINSEKIKLVEEEEQRLEIIEKAKAKLSKEELKVLGLSK